MALQFLLRSRGLTKKGLSCCVWYSPNLLDRESPVILVFLYIPPLFVLSSHPPQTDLINTLYARSRRQPASFVPGLLVDVPELSPSTLG